MLRQRFSDSPEKVNLHTTLLGGGFGRRAVGDSHFVKEAAQVARAIQKPVKVMWTREDDIRGGYYRPAVYTVLKGALDAQGSPLHGNRVLSASRSSREHLLGLP